METSFVRSEIAADPPTASNLRHEFDAWLRAELCLPDGLRYDIVLAVYEAVTNAAEHAYRTVAPPHTMEIGAHYDFATGTLAVTVTDHGRWRERNPHDRRRGRGLILMEGLADRVWIQTTPAGTRAELQWLRLTRPP